MTVAELIAELKQYPPGMEVKIKTDDGNGYCHEDPTLKRIPQWTLSTSTMNGWGYTDIKHEVLEIS